MLDLLRALDKELPNGSEVTLFNMRVNNDLIGELVDSIFTKLSAVLPVQHL